MRACEHTVIYVYEPAFCMQQLCSLLVFENSSNIDFMVTTRARR